MPLVVEDGTGKLDAESYISFADAAQYHTDFGNQGWPTDQTRGEALLRRATAFIDGRWGARYKGIRLTVDQSLGWPRKYAFDDDGRVMRPSVLPKDLLRLAAEIALLLVTDPDFDQAIQRGLRNKSVKIGPIEESSSYDVNGTVVKRYPVLLRYVRTLVEGSGRAVPIERA